MVRGVASLLPGGGVSVDGELLAARTIVLARVTAPDAESAIALANDTTFGLGSNLWTADLDRAQELARRFHAGHTAINGMTTSDPGLPFGGIKDSGYGRELGTYGLHEFVNVHAVVVESPSGPPTTAASIE